jgi:2,3-bisphosphoglycerate-dependent phosphoglycerate mutase
MAKLILVRHSKSEWNALGKWTGWTDVDLNEEGSGDGLPGG